MGSVSKLAIAVTLAGAVAGLAGPAVAGCKRMGFLVNDYGKDGPTNDAKSLLDKHIANWAAEQGIEKYTVGKKDVKCDLFLNLIVVDEHTCTASATVCWGNDKMPSGEREASTGDAPKSEPKPKAKKEAAKAESKPADAKPEEKAAEAKPAEVKSEEHKAAAAETSAPTKVETGALPIDNKAADTAATSSSEAAAKVESTPPSTAAATPPAHQAATDAAEAAASAAERAAAAAERAAAAAERAAAALASANASAPAMPGAANTAAAAGASTPAVPPLAAEGASKP
jgi:hypothetical protein